MLQLPPFRNKIFLKDQKKSLLRYYVWKDENAKVFMKHFFSLKTA
jgi:hypothetical protein